MTVYKHFNSSAKMLELTGPSYSHSLISHSRAWATSNADTEKQCYKSHREDEVSQRLQVDYTEAGHFVPNQELTAAVKANSVSKGEPRRAKGWRQRLLGEVTGLMEGRRMKILRIEATMGGAFHLGINRSPVLTWQVSAVQLFMNLCLQVTQGQALATECSPESRKRAVVFFCLGVA